MPKCEGCKKKALSTPPMRRLGDVARFCVEFSEVPQIDECRLHSEFISNEPTGSYHWLPETKSDNDSQNVVLPS